MNQDRLIKAYVREIFNFLLDREFLSRIKLTFFILIIYRFVSFLPIPGINLEVITDDFISKNFSGSFLGFFNKFSGGALHRMSVMAFGISPYITCSLFFGFAHHFSSYFALLKKEGALGRQKINDYTKLASFVLAFIQGFGWGVYLQCFSNMNLAMYPGWFFNIQTAMFACCGTIIVVWFSDQISLRGVGSGSSMVIYANIVSGIPGFLHFLCFKIKDHEISLLKLFLFIILAFFLLCFVTFCERVYKTIKAESLSNRKALFQQMLPENLVYMKLNPAGIYPAMFAGIIMSLPGMLDNLLHFSKYEWGAWMLASLSSGHYLYIFFHAITIFFTSYVYAELIFNPEETAKRFRNDSIISGRIPGKSTQEFLEEKLFYVATIGGIYLMLVCCLPELFITRQDQSLYISGTSYIIVVGVAADLIDKVSAGVYSKFIEKSMKSIRKGYF